MRIIIPTKGRLNIQTTYKHFPDKYKKMTIFITTEEELEDHKKLYPNVIARPKECNMSIALTREWIFNKYKDERFIVFDDDIANFYDIKLIDGKLKKNRVNNNEEEFDKMFKLIEDAMDKGYSHGGISQSSSPPKSVYPEKFNVRICNSVFYDGPKIPRDLKWNRCAHTEDFDVNLQLLTRGFQNYVVGRYNLNLKVVGLNGGCKDERSFESHNASQIKFQSLWPKFVKIYDKPVKEGPWKGKIKKSLKIFWKRAYKSSQHK